MNIAEKTTHYENIVRQEWTNPTTINAWDVWSEKQAIHCQPLTDALINHASLCAGDIVLDLACGVGQPSLSIARKIAPNGTVIATDLSQGMLNVAEKNAAQADIQNIQFKVADAHNLPFEDNTFDRVVSRLGLMYFWDVETAISEIYRVLKPGGTASFAVWGADDKNQYFGTILVPFIQRKEMPAMPEDAPTPTRFANCAGLTKVFEGKGFNKVSTHEYCEPLPWPGSPATLFKHFYDMAVPLQAYIDSFSEEQQSAAQSEIEQGFSEVWDGEFTRAKASFNVITVEK
jgi:ubiquinone/menaquinone biosynthesis C-methylase UbiE